MKKIMTQMLDKQNSKFEREHIKLSYVKADLNIALSNFRAWKHKLWLEYEEKGGGKGSSIKTDDYSGKGNYYYRFRQDAMSHKARKDMYFPTKALEPIEPVKIRKGTKLVFEERVRTFKEVIASFKKEGKLNKIPLIMTPEGYIYAATASTAMKKKMLILELTFNIDGKLYSLKTFNKNWEWQSKAIWQRSIGMPQSRIAKSLNLSVNTIKAMLLRLKISKFFVPYSSIDWATTGYGRTIGETPSGWRAVLQGGSSGMLYPIDQGEGFEARETIGEMTGAHREGLLETEHSSLEKLQKNIKAFNIDKHKKEVTKRNKQVKKRKKQIVLEQKMTEAKTLQKNILNGFDLETGKYKEVNND